MPFKRGIITLINGPGSYFVFGCSCARLEWQVWRFIPKGEYVPGPTYIFRTRVIG